jgi:hypothetical protein
MAYTAIMIFIETSIFTKEILGHLPGESYRELQSVLMLRPEAGSVIRGSGGLSEDQTRRPDAATS